MNNIVLFIIILVSTFAGGYFFGSKVEEYNHAIDKVQAVSQTLKQERAKQDAKDKELAEANKLISNLRTLNERSSNKPSKDLQSCERERLRLRELTKRCSSVVTRYIEGTDKLIIERK
mgnify:CR=1 FL=1